MKYYLASADGGNICGMYYLAHLYEINQNKEQAELWYQKAFDLFKKEIKRSLDDTELMMGLALMYENGKGTEKNIQLAINLYRQAAELGDEDAKLKLKEFDQKK